MPQLDGSMWRRWNKGIAPFLLLRWMPRSMFLLLHRSGMSFKGDWFFYFYFFIFSFFSFDTPFPLCLCLDIDIGLVGLPSGYPNARKIFCRCKYHHSDHLSSHNYCSLTVLVQTSQKLVLQGMLVQIVPYRLWCQAFLIQLLCISRSSSVRNSQSFD